jgi:hypothetical protein
MVADLCHVVFLFRGAADENTKIRQSFHFVVFSIRGAPGENMKMRVTTEIHLFTK